VAQPPSTCRPAKWALFGGTFDPVHHGHLIVARSVAEQLGVDRITLIPAASPPHKPGPSASGEDRLAMLELAIEGEGVFDVCDIELSRSGPSYTLDTLCQLRRRHGGEAALHWVIGADMLADLPTWYRATEVLEAARIVIAARPPWHRKLEEIFAGLAGSLPPEQVERLRASVVQTPLVDISSTEIRRRVGQGRSIRYLLPEAVREYIGRRGLYAGGGGGERNG